MIHDLDIVLKLMGQPVVSLDAKGVAVVSETVDIANVRLHFQEDKLSVAIQDNGDGFDLTQTLDSAISGGHVGLLGMKQRAEMLGGDVKIRTAKGGGTTIIFNLPIQSKAEGG